MALRIKSSVDLKELEKYGFEYDELYDAYVGGYSNRELHLRIYVNDDDEWNIKAREIKMCEPFRDNDGEENNIELLYDLIKADLVEKVDE